MHPRSPDIVRFDEFNKKNAQYKNNSNSSNCCQKRIGPMFNVRFREGQEGSSMFSPTDLNHSSSSEISQSLDDNLKLEQIMHNLKETVRRLQVSCRCATC